MIKANELRIGNILNAGKVTAIQSGPTEIVLFDGYISWRNSIMQDDWLQGIPITSAILQKCGFIITRNGASIVYNESGNIIILNLVDCVYELVYLGTKIYYLHQLQNIYFYLTGEELDINL